MEEHWDSFSYEIFVGIGSTHGGDVFDFSNDIHFKSFCVLYMCTVLVFKEYGVIGIFG